MNTLYYGDNLDIFQNKINDETDDLIYLDPPFKSGVNYNLLFQAAGNDAVDAQVEAGGNQPKKLMMMSEITANSVSRFQASGSGLAIEMR